MVLLGVASSAELHGEGYFVRLGAVLESNEKRTKL